MYQRFNPYEWLLQDNQKEEDVEKRLRVPKMVIHNPPTILVNYALMIARTFYSVEAFVILRVLANLEFADDDLLAQNLNLIPSEIRKNLEKLRVDRIVTQVLHGRERGDMDFGKSPVKQYWFIDYQTLVNVTLYRAKRVMSLIKENVDQRGVTLLCQQCKKKYTLLDMADLRASTEAKGKRGLCCLTCDGNIIEVKPRALIRENHHLVVESQCAVLTKMAMECVRVFEEELIVDEGRTIFASDYVPKLKVEKKVETVKRDFKTPSWFSKIAEVDVDKKEFVVISTWDQEVYDEVLPKMEEFVRNERDHPKPFHFDDVVQVNGKDVPFDVALNDQTQMTDEEYCSFFELCEKRFSSGF